LEVLQALHETVNARFSVEGVEKAVGSTIGVRQGDLPGPILFNFHVAGELIHDGRPMAWQEAIQEERETPPPVLQTKEDCVLNGSVGMGARGGCGGAGGARHAVRRRHRRVPPAPSGARCGRGAVQDVPRPVEILSSADASKFCAKARKGGMELTSAIAAKGDEIRTIKSGGGSKDGIVKAVQELLALKVKYKEVTGKDHGPPPSSAKKKKKTKAAASVPAAAPQSASRPPPSPLESLSDEDLETCVRVLDTLGVDAACIEDARFKQFRRSVMPVVKHVQKKMFKGSGSMTEYLEKQHIRREAEGRKAKQKALDQKHINAVKLRSARVDNLRKLQEETPALMSVPMIADGQATSAVNAAMITDGQATPAQKPDTAMPGKYRTEAEVADPRSCYVCKGRFTKLHFFYDQMCPECAALNYTKREQLADLKGRVALVTGARIKIGMCVALKLLACGCTVIATTRFPHDAALRFAKDPNFDSFRDRLHLYPLDLRDVAHVRWFASHLVQQYDRIDIVIHNACQTIRRPPQYYAHLLDRELSPGTQLTQEQASAIRPTLRMCIEAEQQRSSSAIAAARDDDGGHTDGAGAASTRGSTATMPTMPTPVVSAIEDADSQDLVNHSMEGRALVNHSCESLYTMVNHSCAATALKSQVVLTEEDRALSGLGVTGGVGTPLTGGVGSEEETIPTELATATTAAAAAFPAAMFDVNAQQLDLRKKNTWMLQLQEVDPVEAAEVLAINTLAPFVLNSLLVPHMGTNSSTSVAEGAEVGGTAASAAEGGERGGGAARDGYIINVSAMEGKFYRHKMPTHPHTNMAKAALNMMTRTCADELSKQRIYMNSVDTGEGGATDLLFNWSLSHAV
jgi:NAD(P)-dependent dehydrogenase (short-subunit alcohol dehydrogenase family)